MIGIIIVTHLDIASPLIQEAERVLAKKLNMLIGINLHSYESSQALNAKICDAIQFLKKTDEGCSGILILSDLFGSTPTNVCVSQLKSKETDIEILTGVNLPMLISSLTYRDRLDLKSLADKVLLDGQKGIQRIKNFAPTSS
ncbi:MAG: hypothetical protein HYT97_00410 [Elusimicrobia bacterium]|nr:hypothetical protein [Elusimicrobiota bacterium]